MTSPAKKPREAKTPRAVVTNALQGYKDHLPSDAPYWHLVKEKLGRLVDDFGFQQMDTPIIEDPRLYQALRGSGFPIDEILTVHDAEEKTSALRPEALLSLARAYREHGFVNQPQPIKIFYETPLFRAEPKTNATTLWQYTEFGCVIFGDPQPIVDAQLIAAAYYALRELGITAKLHLNSLGHDACRNAYQALLLEYFRAHRSTLCESCKAKLTAKQPFALLDCREEGCQTVLNEAPQIVDHLCEPDREHFVKVLEHLDEVEVEYVLDSRLVANTTLNNRTLAKFFVESEGREPYSLATGARHDALLPLVGAPVSPTFGIAFGLERIVLAMKEQNVPTPPPPPPDVFLAQLGDKARRKSLQLFIKLRSEGVRVSESLSKDGIKEQLESATRLKAKFALILGQKEILDDTILIRDMENGIQEVSSFEKVIPELKKRLAKTTPSTFVTSVAAERTDISHEIEEQSHLPENEEEIP